MVILRPLYRAAHDSVCGHRGGWARQRRTWTADAVSPNLKLVVDPEEKALRSFDQFIGVRSDWPLLAGMLFDIRMDLPYLSGGLISLIGFLLCLIFLRPSASGAVKVQGKDPHRSPRT